MPQTRFGGSFAPPIDPAKLDAYRALAATASEHVRSEMRKLIAMLAAYHGEPLPSGPGMLHASGVGMVVPLSGETVTRLWDHVPWDDELNMLAAVFDRIDPIADKPLRNAAFHLLWYARELSLDRHPLTV